MMIFTQITFKSRIKALNLMFMLMVNIMINFITSVRDHNIQNALAVIAISYLEKMDVNNIKEALETFGGVKRRFNETNVANQVLVDDYAHHPREISATIETARKNIQIKILWQFSNHILSQEHKPS